MHQVLRTSKIFGTAIARQRKLAGLTQSDLAAKVNTRQATISDLENGKGGTRIDIVFAIMAALNLEIVLQDRGTGTKLIADLF